MAYGGSRRKRYVEKCDMSDSTSTTSMKDWVRSGWRVMPGNVPATSEALTPSPPMANKDIFNGRVPSDDLLQEEHDPICSWELWEDLDEAQKAWGEYEATGIEGTIPYSEYRAKRLGSKYRV